MNSELSILANLGCYADFTFPALGTNAQPGKVNSIYYAKDSPAPKSYDSGIDVTVGGRPWGDLMIFQGPIYVDWNGKYVESASIERFTKYHSRRISAWRQAGIHVKGRPEWLFVKLHTHGMQSRDSFLSDEFHKIHDLIALAELAANKCPEISSYRDDLALLNTYAVEVRYPDDFFMPDAREAKDAFVISGRITNISCGFILYLL